ncbi:hypothetical protein QTP88_008528 [Uroleucon formosanum]
MKIMCQYREPYRAYIENITFTYCNMGMRIFLRYSNSNKIEWRKKKYILKTRAKGCTLYIGSQISAYLCNLYGSFERHLCFAILEIEYGFGYTVCIYDTKIGACHIIYFECSMLLIVHIRLEHLSYVHIRYALVGTAAGNGMVRADSDFCCIIKSTD